MGKYERVMKKCDYFYKYPKKEELYDLRYVIRAFLIPRLQKFIEDSSQIIDWDHHKKDDGVDVIKEIKIIIRELKYIEDKMDDWDVKTYKRCENYAEDAFTRLGKIYFYLWY